MVDFDRVEYKQNQNEQKRPEKHAFDQTTT